MISAIFKTFLLSLCIVANTHLAYAQTASILPPAKTQFLDNNGKPLTSGTVDFYIPSTTTRKTTWQNSAETIANANPVVLDAGGRAIIYGDGSYRQVVKDRLGNIIWDQLTSSTGSGGGSTPTATGDGDLVGTIKPWAGMTAPNQYAFTYGQEVNRITYATLFTAMTSTQAAFCTSASPTISGLTDTTNFWIGMSVELTCVAAGFSTIVSKTSTTVTLAANANVTTNLNATFFPWGRGNGSTTFNLPDFRGLIPTGNNIMGGVASSNLNTTYFGAATPNATGAPGGSQSMQLVEANIPSITSTGNNSISVSSVQGAIPSNTSSAGTVEALSGSRFGVLGGSSGTVAPVINSAITSTNASQSIVVTTSGTLSTAFSLVQPSKTVNYIIKTTPDSNSATASGVTSLGLMTGDIACGSGVTCTGNTISLSSNCIALGGFLVGTGSTTVCSTSPAPLAGVLNGTLNLSPLAASAQSGINITTSGPSSGSTVGAIYSNLVQGSWNNTLTGTTTPGTSDCQCWSLFQVAASTGPNFNGVESYGLSVGNVISGANTTTSDIVGISGGVYTNYAVPNARFYGGVFSATAGTNGTTSTLLGLEVAASIANATGGAVSERIGVNAISYETHRATGFDGAFAVSGGNPGGQFKYALGLFTKGGTLADALSTTGSIIYAESAQTVDSIINVPLLTISGYVFDTKYAKLTGGGTLALGTAASPGGIGIKGGTSDTLATTLSYNNVDKWSYGAIASSFYVSAVGSASASISIDQTSHVLAAPSGLAVQTSFTSTAPLAITSANANALAVGANGTTNPVLQVDSSTASVATGLNLKGAAAAGRMAVSVTSSGTDEGLSVDAKGAGTIRLGATSTGAVEFSRNAVPTTNDGAALGTTALNWSDLFLATGGVINWNNGVATITESSGNLNYAIASGKTYTFTGGDVTNPIIKARSNGSTVAASFEIGRTASESTWAIPAFSTQYWTNSLAGDSIIRALSGRIVLTTGYSTGGVVLDTSDNVAIGSTTAATSSITGALKVSGGLSAAGAGWFGTYMAVTPTVVNSLPSCVAGLDGARAFVTNNNTATAFAGAVTTGGVNHHPVYCDGVATAWKQG